MANNQSVRRRLDAFTRGRIIGKLEEGRSVTSVAAEFGIAHSIVPRLWRQFQTTGTAIRGFSSGRPRGTTPADDRYIVLQARRNRRQTAGEIARHTTQATGRPISRFTWPEDCTVVVCLHDALYDQSRFSLSSDSHRILIWRERGSRNHPSNIIERDRYGGRGVLVWGGIMLGSRTDLHIFDAGTVNGTRYCNEIVVPCVRLFRGAMGLQFLFMDDNAPCHRTVAAKQLLESSRLATRTLPPVTIRELRLALQDEWAAMPQQLIDTLILSMGRRCETCLAFHAEIGEVEKCGVAIYRHFGEFRRAKSYCHLYGAQGPCHDEFLWPLSDYVRQEKETPNSTTLSKKIAQGNLTANCKRLISWFLLFKGSELGRKIVPVRPPKF
ncbi:transposable element Tcb1 transposase [Trichonephila clavipes]|nr:transposable element Tcb1 transposase [Trichonephila clavipes]